MKKTSYASLASLILVLSACVDLNASTPRPDYTIRVVPTAQGDVAVAPPCPSYATELADPLDNQPMPQFGCASTQNLASMIENPDDLVQGRTLGPARAVTSVGAIRRYDNNQTRGLIIPGAEANQQATTTAPAAASALTGDVTGGASAAPAAAAGAAGAP